MSIIGPLLFKIFINDKLCLIQEVYICNFVDDISLSVIEDNFKGVLKKNFEPLQVWFFENDIFLNPTKYHHLIINKDITNKSIELGKKT